MPRGAEPEADHLFLGSGGDMGALMRTYDWSATPVGPSADWPQSLKTTVGIMLNSGHAMCLAWGPELTFFYNDAYVPFLQSRHPAALGRPLDKIWSDVWHDIAPLVERAMAGEATWVEDWPLVMERDAGPQETWWTFCYSPVRDENGLVAGMLNVCSNSTDKVLADRRLAAQVDRQRRLFDQAPGFIGISNGPEHVYEFVNSAYARLCGARDYLGKTVREVLPDIAGQGFYELLDTVYATGKRHTAEGVAVSMKRTPGADSERRFVSFVYEPVIGEAGEVTGIFTQGYDVTDAHNAQEARRVDAEFLRSVLTSSDDCIKVLDLNANLLFMNDGALREMEVSDFNAIEGCPWLGFWKGHGHTDAIAAIELAKAGGSGRFQGSADTMAGTPKWWDVQVTSILDSDGKPEKLLCVSRDISSQKWADLALRESEERYRLLFETIEVGFCIIEVKFDESQRPIDFRYIDVNPAFERHSGLVDVTGRWISEFLPEITGDWLEMYGRVASTGKPMRIETEVEALGRWFEVHAFRSSQFEANRVAVLFSDISDRKRSEQAVLQFNADLERQVAERTREQSRTWEVSPDLLSVVTSDGYFESVNPAWQRLLGWTEEELRTTPLFDFIHPDDLEASHAGFAELGRGQPVLRFENRYRCKEGGFRWLSWVAVPERGKFYCGARDITEEKSQAVDLAERTADLDRIWKNSRDMLVVASADGIFRAVNPAWTRILGYEPAEIVGHSFAEFVWPDDTEASQLAVRSSVFGEKLSGFVNRYRHKDGTPRWISWQTSFENDAIYGYARDITVEKAHEAELDLAQAALRQSHKLEAMGQLTGGVAHDFNNILTPIMGSLDLLQRRGFGSDREKRMIDGAMQSAERAKTLVKRLLAFARRQPLQLRAVDLGRLIAGMGDLVSSTSGPRIKVKIKVAADLPTVMIDPNQLEMAILNLSVNARDAMRGGGTLTISAQCETVEGRHRTNLAAGQYIRLSVTDTGAGMDAATLDRATEPFFSTKGIGEGTGLGLSMAHGLVAQLGGALALASEPGVGTVVELWLPISDEDEAFAQPLDEPGKSAAAAGVVLLVDDEELVRMSTADMLTDLGYAVVEAASAEEALALLDGGLTIDMLITDHLMPGMSGAELSRVVREHWPDLSILIVSGYADVDEISGDMARLTKPFRQVDLAACVRELAVN